MKLITFYTEINLLMKYAVKIIMLLKLNAFKIEIMH